MADRYPLVVDSSTNTLKEIPSGDNLNLSGSSIVNVSSVTATSVASTTFTANLADRIGNHNISPIVGLTTIYVTTSGNDVTGTGTSAAPFATPHRAMEYLRGKPIISSSEGREPYVYVNVGVGTYNFGLKITNQGTGYYQNMRTAVTGGSGSGAYVGIITTNNSAGLVTCVVLIHGGEGYVAGETLGISTTFGSGLQFIPLTVSATGAILGPLRVDHPQGELIAITGNVSGTRPGLRGNHYYNQGGVGVGSNPALAGATWSLDSLGYNRYDSTSPAGAYPNPMGARGATQASKIYNTSIIEAHYQSRLYFHNCGGLVTHGTGSRVDKLAIMAPDGIGGIHGVSGDVSVNNNTVFGDKMQGPAFGHLTGFTNVTYNMTNSVPIAYKSHRYPIGGYIGGFGSLGPNLVIYNFAYGIVMWGGSGDVQEIAIVNCRSGAQAQSSAAINMDGVIMLNCAGYGILAHRGGDVEFLRGISNNHGIDGISLLTSSNVVVGSPNIGLSSAHDNQYTIVANNGTAGIRATYGGVLQTSGVAYVHGNASFQVAASTGSLIGVGNSAYVIQGAGSATLFSPAFDTLGSSGEIIIG